MSWDIKLLLNIMTTIRIYYTCNIEVFNRYTTYTILLTAKKIRIHT